MRIESVVGGVLLFIGGLAWMALAMVGWITLPAIPGLGVWMLQAAALPLPGLIFGAAAVMLRSAVGPPGGPSTVAETVLPALLALLSVGLIVVLVACAKAGNPDPVRTALLIVLGTLTVAIGYFALERVRRGDGISFETHWGGLGGGLGGWRLSGSAVLLLLLLITGAATLVVGGGAPTAATSDPSAHDGAATHAGDHGAPKTASPKSGK